MGPAAYTRCRFLHPGAAPSGMLHKVGICSHVLRHRSPGIWVLDASQCYDGVLWEDYKDGEVFGDQDCLEEKGRLDQEKRLQGYCGECPLKIIL